MIMTGLLIGSGGFLGALARYGVSVWSKRFRSHFPIGTFVVNVVGAFLLGLLTGKQLEANALLFLGTGFMGSFTTFSTFKFENIVLHQNRKWSVAALYLLLSYVIGLIFAFLGFWLGQAQS